MLNEKTILITGAARRLGRIFALACARAGADVVIHHAHSETEAESLRAEIISLGRKGVDFQSGLERFSPSRKIDSVNQRIHSSARSRQ